jgi:integrase
MKPKVAFLARVKLGDDYGFERVQIKRGRPVEPQGATTYYLRYTESGKRRTEPVGPFLDEAFTAYQNREVRLECIARGLPVPEAPSKRVSIADAVEEFRSELRTLDKAAGTVLAYQNAVESFRGSCVKLYIDELDRRDVLEYIKWLRENLERRGVGEQNTTIRNRLRYLSVFLNRFGVKMPLRAKEWPKVSKKNPDRYSIEDVNRMLDAANEDEKDLIQFFLYTGFRDEEAAYCKFKDIDFKRETINVHDKPEYAWTVKDREQRPIDIPLPPDFVKRMKARRDRNKGCDLIFPNGKGGPDTHIIRRVRRLADRAGIEGRVTLHKFRRTFGTLYAKKFGVRTAQKLLGHADIETTMAYLAAEEMDSVEAKKAVSEVFSGVTNE